MRGAPDSDVPGPRGDPRPWSAVPTHRGRKRPAAGLGRWRRWRWGGQGSGTRYNGKEPRRARLALPALPPGDGGEGVQITPRAPALPAPPQRGRANAAAPTESWPDPPSGRTRHNPPTQRHFSQARKKSRCPIPSLGGIRRAGPSPEGRPSRLGPAPSSPEGSGPPALLRAALSAGARQRPPPRAPMSPPQPAPQRPEGTVPSGVPRGPQLTARRRGLSRGEGSVALPPAPGAQRGGGGGLLLAMPRARAAEDRADAADRAGRGAARSPGRSGDELAAARPELPPSARRSPAAPARASKRASEQAS